MLKRREAQQLAELGGNADLEDATPSEKLALLKSSGTTLTELHAGVLRPYPPPIVERVRARISRRRRLGLPHQDCTVRACSCAALADALEAAGEDGTKAAILGAARKLHRQRRPRRTPPPILCEGAAPRPRAPAAAPAQTNGRPPQPPPRPSRPVHRTEKWFDPPSKSPLDMSF